MSDPAPPNASTYCDYNDTFKRYDAMRIPIGLAELRGLLQAAGAARGVALDAQDLLEGGFGTGSYLHAMCADVKSLAGIEGSRTGLEQARVKLAGRADVNLQIGDILALPYDDSRFDGYMVNQVLHHLDTDPGFPNLDRFLAEAYRALRPGGLLTVNTCSQDHLDPETGVYWHYAYIPDAARAMRARYVALAELERRMAAAGFVDCARTRSSGQLFASVYYDDPNTVLDPAFKSADSVYSLIAEDDLARADEQLRSDIASGAITGILASHAESRGKLGEAVIVSASKPR